ncbi:MAG: prolyl oligopeptidase family serine peptidase [Acidobacteriota bacterium]
MYRRMTSAGSIIILLAVMLSLANAQTGYQKPAKVITDILNAPSSPGVSLSPTRDRMLLLEAASLPGIDELAEPMLRLGGTRINPNTNGPHRGGRLTGLRLKNLADGKEIKIIVPAGAALGMPNWSPDGNRFAFTNTLENGIELWIGNARTGAARRVPGVRINSAFGSPLQWMPDGHTLLCRTIATGRGAAPVASKVPTGPTVQENYGKASPTATFQDLLRNKHDEALFDYFMTAQLVFVDSASLGLTLIGKPAIFSEAEPAPDGRHLLIARTHKPYSYLLPSQSFPKDVEIWDRSGRVVKKLVSLPLMEQVPIEGVASGPRGYQWRPTEPATLLWVEALDGGDSRKAAPFRDRVLMFKAPFQTEPQELVRTEHRFAGLTWGEKDGVVLVRDSDRRRRWNRTFLLNADRPSEPARVIWDRSAQDRYNDPGIPLMRLLANGQRAILQDGNHIYLSGQGASPEGDRPFLDRFDLQSLKSERVFQCDNKSYESVVALLDDSGSRFITRYETVSNPPNYFIRKAGQESREALTNFPDPAPQLRGIRKELVKYKRADGVDLSFTLYLPPDYKPGTRLPTLVWAYPLEFTDAGNAGQVSGSTNRFTTISGASHLFLLLAGYAILNDATMPVIGDTETMNNTYVEQIVASAQAAIDKAVEIGVTDRQRVGVGGHSYGAFMTANLLAHSDLFRAGIARSGAYNRTLTPFGFQSERRTFWEAPEMYFKVSPFMVANKIKEPILLIHGEADNNAGTHPIQSDRLYQALRGNGGNVRYVTLPLEAHGYGARESIEHTLWEMITWMDRFMKNRTEPASAASTGGQR